MADVTGRIGDNDVALDNAATEATLKALLLAVAGSTKQMDKLINLASKSGMDPKAIQEANKGASALGQAAFGAGKVASVAMNGLAKGAMILGGVIGDLAASALQTGKNLMNFAGDLLDGKATVSGIFGAFKDLPLGMGIVAGLFEKMAKMQEENLEAYRKLSRSGINLAGDLLSVKQQALSMGMSLEQFAGFMTKNSEVFASFGGTVDEGARNFTRFSKELRNSNIGKTLSGLGYSIEEISQSAANYIRISGGRTAEELKNTKGLTASAGEYMRQLDMLAGLTGKSREEQEKLLQEESANAAWQAHLQTLGDEERKKAIAAFNETLQTGGKGAADVLRSKLMGIPPLTEAGQTFMAMATNGTEALDKVTKSVQTQGKTLDDVNRDMAGFRVGLGKDGKQLTGPLGAALIAQGGAMGEFTSKAIATQNQLNNQNVKSVEDEIALRKRLADEQAAREKSAAAAAAESEKALKALGDQLMGALMPVFKILTPIVTDLANQFMQFASNNMPAIKEAMTKLAVFIGNFAKDIFSEAGQQKIINDIAYYFKLMLIEVKKAIVPFYNEEDAAKDRANLEIQKKAYDARAEEARLELDLSAKQQELKKRLADQENKLTAEQRTKLEGEIASLAKAKADKKALADAAAADNKEAQKDANKPLSGGAGAAAGAASLGTAGALIGSIIPVVGTAIGGAIGAALGGVAGGLGLIRYGSDNSKPEEPQGKGTKKDDLPKAAIGGFFSGPSTGYPVMLHGDEAVVPLGGIGKKNPLEDFFKKMPSMDEVGSKLKDVAKDPSGAMSDFAKTIEQFGQKVVEVAKPTVKDVQTGLQGTAGALGFGNENLVKELQTLNKQTGQMLAYIKRSVELDEQHLGAVRGLNGNLFQ